MPPALAVSWHSALLDLSRIESGGWRPAPVSLGIEPLVRECMSQFSATAEEKGLTFAESFGADARQVFADPTALRQILINLIDNAVRHTIAGGISVEVTSEERGIRVAVKDTGAGIPPEHLPRIFERFYRADAGRARYQGGTGLGLAIVRHLTEAHGGNVTATSAPGTGTTVSVLFPHPTTTT